MNSLILAAVMIAAYIVAYHTYGKYLARRIFRIDAEAKCPSESLRDDMDYVPTNKHVLFGHHFTSIAGLGPIVGPALAIIWGWVPAALWVLIGPIFIGAVHDFGALIVSLRGQGRSIGDLSAGIVNARVRTLFLLIIFFGLWIVIAIFALIIAILFNMYPQAVLPVWVEVPIALALGFLIYKRRVNHAILGIGAVVLMYVTVVIGAYCPLPLPKIFGFSPLVVWMVILLVYAYIASTLPVQTLLQPRDYINSHQLLVALVLLALGTIVAHPVVVAPALNTSPVGAPPMLPFLFVVIACGAVSGFHSLVSSGTSSKQCDNERSSLFVGYGSMLVEAALAAFVIVAVAAGLGMGLAVEGKGVLVGADAFNHHYATWATAEGLPAKLSAFVTGSANMIETLKIPAEITVAIMGVFLVSFAATTLDTATRIQRYCVTELASAWGVKLLTGKHGATLFAVLSAFVLAFYNGSGKGAMTLWPLFGTVNQLLAGLALLVVTIYLARRRINILLTGLPMVFMVLMTGWAMVLNLGRFRSESNWLLFGVGLAVLALEVWMVVESVLVLAKVYGKPAGEAAPA